MALFALQKSVALKPLSAGTARWLLRISKGESTISAWRNFGMSRLRNWKAEQPDIQAAAA